MLQSASEAHRVESRMPPAAWVSPHLCRGRMDAGYFRPEFLEAASAVSRFPTVRRVGDLLQRKNGLAGGATPLGAEYETQGIPFLRVQNVRTCMVDLEDVVYIDRKTHEGELKRSQLRPGDVLLTITGVTYGLAACVPQAIDTANINQHIVRMRLRDEVSPYYVTAFLNSHFGKAQMDQQIKGTSRPALDYASICSIVIPTPTRSCQDRIGDKVAQAEALRHEADSLMHSAENLLADILHMSSIAERDELAYWIEPEDVDTRLDAEFNRPRFSTVTASLRRSAKEGGFQLGKLGEVLKVVPAVGSPSELGAGEFSYIDISCLDTSHGIVSGVVRLPVGDAPSRAGKRVKANQVILSTVRPTRRAAAVIPQKLDGCFASTGFTVLEVPDCIGRYYAHLVLRSPCLLTQYERRVTGSMYPAISEAELTACLFPVIPPEPRAQIDRMVSKAQANGYVAQVMIAEAIAAVEHLVQGESPAMADTSLPDHAEGGADE